jgi:hypothetical protein
LLYRYIDRNEPTDDRENLFEKIIETLSELKPGSQDLIDFVTKPLVMEFYVNIGLLPSKMQKEIYGN